MEFIEYFVGDPLPFDVEVLTPSVLTANRVEIAVIADDDKQPGAFDTARRPSRRSAKLKNLTREKKLDVGEIGILNSIFLVDRGSICFATPPPFQALLNIDRIDRQA